MARENDFHDHLRHALSHLYDPDTLRRSPLLRVLCRDEEIKTPLVLSRILVQAIENLKPPSGTSSESPMLHTYEFLIYRYIHRATQRDLAQQLAVSARQVRRVQERAIAVLAGHLRDQYNLSDADLLSVSDAAGSGVRVSETTNALRDEFRWLQTDGPGRGVNLSDEISAVQEVLTPLVDQYRVRLRVDVCEDLMPPSVPSAAVRQVLLSLLTVAIHFAREGEVLVYCEQEDWQIGLNVRAKGRGATEMSIQTADARCLSDAEGLLGLCGGTLSITTGGSRLSIELKLPLANAVPVLAIDDNRDILRLFERYTAGTRYRLISCHDPRQAVPMAQRENPALIVLDIMMANVDGWALLAELRRHEATAACPIIVCTVLAQREIAVSLGAKVFLSKPVRQQEFLKTLDEQFVGLAQPSAPERRTAAEDRTATDHGDMRL